MNCIFNILTTVKPENGFSTKEQISTNLYCDMHREVLHELSTCGETFCVYSEHAGRLSLIICIVEGIDNLVHIILKIHTRKKVSLFKMSRYRNRDFLR